MQKKVWYILGIVAACLWMPALLLSCVQWRVYDDLDYFAKEYAKYDVLTDVGMEMEELLYVTEEMMAYLKDERDTLQVTAVVDGREQPFFSEKEIRHMVDVKNLFLSGTQIRNGCALLAAALSILLLWRKQGRILLRSLQMGIGLFFAACMVFVGLMLTDFTKYFTQFHLLFFDNDDWILDARVDRLINIVPEGFFMDTALWIGGAFLVICVGLLAGAGLLLRKGRKGVTESLDEKNGSVELH